MFQTFTYQNLYPELVDGFFLCDHERLHTLWGDEILGSDLLSRVRVIEEGNELCRKGIAIPIFGVEPQNYTITVRHESAPSSLVNPPRIISTGWAITTDSGNLVICGLSNLMYWDPSDVARISEGAHNAYVHFHILPGSYSVGIWGGINYEDSDEPELVLEFVFSAIDSGSVPEFNADLAKGFDFYTDQESSPSTEVIMAPSIDKLPRKEHRDDSLAFQILSCFNKSAFSSFITSLFDDDEEPFIEINELGEGIFRKPWWDSYGSSLETTYILQYLPLEILSKPNLVDVAEDPSLSFQLAKIKEHYKKKVGAFGMVSGHLVLANQLRTLGFLTNLFGVEKSQYYDTLIPSYQQLLQSINLYVPTILLGSYDSFIDLSSEKTTRTLQQFLKQYSDGITVSLSVDDASVSCFTSERNFSGVLNVSKYVCEPILITEILEKKKAIKEFETLLRAETKENELEDFLRAHYVDIFGYNYDRIETQLWLRFPELDISHKNRRLDIFLRNSVASDWDLFEIKRVIPLTGMYRDVPTIAKEISYAVQQVKSYARLLNQDRVKRSLEKQGIEYYEPSLNLVVGRTPSIPHDQWRWLVTSHDRDVRILTYDDLLSQMKNRLGVYDQFLKSISKE